MNLLELVVSCAVGALLMSGLATSLFFAGRTLDDQTPLAEQTQAEEILGVMMRDMSAALTFDERTSHAATFTVPDRNGDSQVETLRYSWSGIQGDPLLHQVNDGPVVVLAENVQDLDLTYLTRQIEGG